MGWSSTRLKVSAVTTRRSCRQAKCRSAASSSSTGCSQVGHHQRASTGVPQASWRGGSPPSRWRAPQSASSRSAPASSWPGRGQLVDEALRALRVGLGDHQALALEPPQPLREHVRGDPASCLLEVAEAARAVEQRLDQQQRPAVADAVERRRERRGRLGSATAGNAYCCMPATVVTCNSQVTKGAVEMEAHDDFAGRDRGRPPSGSGPSVVGLGRGLGPRLAAW